MVRLLNRYRKELGVTALPSELEATATATIRQLQQETATLSLSSPTLNAGTLAFDVDIGNVTGHKLPTGYPSRRVWLHVTVRNERGDAVFESGAFTTTGSIVGNDSDADPLRWSRTMTRSPDPTRCRSTSRSWATSAAHRRPDC